MPYVKRICAFCQKEFLHREFPSNPLKKFEPCCSHKCGTKLRHASVRIPIEIRFWSKVKMGGPDDCWEWQGIKDRHGYGYLEIGDRKTVKAHRFAYMLKHGPIPSSVLVCHKCDNRLCCNENHHFTGTSADNNADKYSKGRQSRGEAIASSKITVQQVLSIRTLYKTGNYTHKSLAPHFGLTPGTIGKITSRKIWKHV
jgi:hypothetical protein